MSPFVPWIYALSMILENGSSQWNIIFKWGIYIYNMLFFFGRGSDQPMCLPALPVIRGVDAHGLFFKMIPPGKTTWLRNI